MTPPPSSPKSSQFPPTPNFYNVRLSNKPIFLRRTSIRPPHLQKLVSSQPLSPVRIPSSKRQPVHNELASFTSDYIKPLFFGTDKSKKVDSELSRRSNTAISLNIYEASTQTLAPTSTTSAQTLKLLPFTSDQDVSSLLKTIQRQRPIAGSSSAAVQTAPEQIDGATKTNTRLIGIEEIQMDLHAQAKFRTAVTADTKRPLALESEEVQMERHKCILSKKVNEWVKTQLRAKFTGRNISVAETKENSTLVCNEAETIILKEIEHSKEEENEGKEQQVEFVPPLWNLLSSSAALGTYLDQYVEELIGNTIDLESKSLIREALQEFPDELARQRQEKHRLQMLEEWENRLREEERRIEKRENDGILKARLREETEKKDKELLEHLRIEEEAIRKQAEMERRLKVVEEHGNQQEEMRLRLEDELWHLKKEEQRRRDEKESQRFRELESERQRMENEIRRQKDLDERRLMMEDQARSNDTRREFIEVEILPTEDVMTENGHLDDKVWKLNRFSGLFLTSLC